MSNITIQSRKTQEDLANINNVASDAVSRLGTVENELQNNLGNRVNDILNEGYVRATLDNFLASDDELSQALTDAIQARANLHDSVKAKYNRLVQVLYEGLDIQGIAQHELELGDVNEAHTGGGGDEHHWEPPAFVLEAGKSYVINHGFKLDKDSGFSTSMESFGDVDGNLWDWSKVASVAMDPNAPAGFNVDSDGKITYGEAFGSSGESHTISLVGVDGVEATLSLQDA